MAVFVLPKNSKKNFPSADIANFSCNVFEPTHSTHCRDRYLRDQALRLLVFSYSLDIWGQFCCHH